MDLASIAKVAQRSGMVLRPKLAASSECPDKATGGTTPSSIVPVGITGAGKRFCVKIDQTGKICGMGSRTFSGKYVCPQHGPLG